MGEAMKIAEENAPKYSHIVAIGGDGTLHEVVNGLLKGVKVGKTPIVSLIPAGTANDFAKTLPFFKNATQLVQGLGNSKIVLCDVGLLAYRNEDGSEAERYFINIADAGIGAAVVNEVNNQPKKYGANVAFFRAILKAFRKYKNIRVHCTADDWEWGGKIKMLTMANGKYFGSGMMIAPQADISDGKMGVTIAANISTYDYIKNLPTLKSGGYIRHPQVFYKETTSLRLDSPEKCPIEADGEMIGFTPAQVTILPKRLRFLTAAPA